MKTNWKTCMVLLLIFFLHATISFLIHHFLIQPPAHGLGWCLEIISAMIFMVILALGCKQIFSVPVKRLAESERYYRSILFGMSDEVIILDADYRIKDINRETIPDADIPREKAIGRSPHEVFPGGSAIFKNGETEEMAASVLQNRRPRHCRQKARDENGREMWKDIRMSPLLDENGQKRYIILTVRDVTREVQLEDQLRQSQKLEAIGALAGGVAHDFNNLLMTILLNIEYVMSKCPADGAERESLEMALSAGRRASDLVDQILIFSRKGQAAKKPLVLAPLVKETLKMLRASLPSTIEIKQQIDADMEMVLADPAHIRQILVNLCANAADAMKGGPGVIRVILAEHVPTNDDPFPEKETRPYLKLTIEDNGSGMSKSVQDNIFDPFFTTRPLKAAGMGLSAAHGVVKGMEGAILVSSAPEKGSRFDILLPCFVPEKETPKAAEPAADQGQEKGRILVVDDDKTVVHILTKTLSDVGYEVTGETCGEQALNLFKAAPDQFDMLITDLTMPGMTGIELSGKVQAIRPGFPVVMTTGYGELLAPADARKMGVHELMAKPVSGARLLTVTRRILADEN